MMTAYAGTLNGTILYGSAGLSADLSTYTDDFSTSGALALAPSGGTWTYGGAVSAPVNHAGNIVPLFNSEYLNKVLVVPASQDAGYITADTDLTIEVYNGKTVAQTLTAIAGTGTTGLTFTDPYGTPLHLPASESKTYTVTLGASGPATISAAYAFTVSGVDYLATITGSRLAVFAFKPDWGPGIKETVSYLTDVLTSHDGHRQRIQLRAVPVRNLRYQHVELSARPASAMLALLWSWQESAYGVPVWTDEQTLAATLASGSSVIPVTVTGYDWEADQFVLLWQDWQTWEAAQIQSVGASSITLTGGTVASWPGTTTKVMPMRGGRLEAKQTIRRPGGGVGVIELVWRLI